MNKNSTSFEDWNYSFINNDIESCFFYETTSLSHESRNSLLHWELNNVRSPQPPATIYTFVGKRCVDIVVSSFFILFILSWLVPSIALLIYFDSPGPFYFIQRRTGIKGKPFFCLKFRTMAHVSVNTDFQQTIKNDNRVTRVGQFLRRTNLDEMLQFINVLAGDMTLVGPRPHAIEHDTMYWSSNAYRARYLVKPGITGLAQIKGARGATNNPQSMGHRVRYDHLYINKRTFMLDVKICITTALTTIQGDKNAW